MEVPLRRPAVTFPFASSPGVDNNADCLPVTVIQLSKDAAIQQNPRIAVQHWLEPQPGNAMPDGIAALAYLGDWADAAAHPFVFATTQIGRSQLSELPLGLPRICSPERIAEAMTGEVFERGN